MDFGDLYMNKEVFLLQVTEEAVIIFNTSRGETQVTAFTHSQWGHLCKAVEDMKEELKADMKALPGNTENTLRRPLLSEISFKDFPK